MKLAEILSRYSWPEVEPVYLRLYPKEKRRRKKARQAFENIRSLKAADSKMVIHIGFQDDEEVGYHDVSGSDGSSTENGEKKRFSLFLVDWDEWLGMKIEVDTIEKYSELETLCHIFWEMTWCGYSMEDVRSFREELKLTEADPEFVREKQFSP